MARIDRYKKHNKDFIYHAFNRGVNKNKIFIDQQDYFVYLRKIKKYKEIYKIEFINYSLLPNHFHYTIRQLSEIPISKFMHALHTSYGNYFNQRHKRVGHLFQGRYNQRIVADLPYFIWLSAYINGNASIHKIVADPKDWIYSSYLDYVGLREGGFCNPESVLKNFKNKDEYSEYVKQVMVESKNKKEALREAEFE